LLIGASALLGTIQVRHPQYETVLRALEALTARGRDLYIVPQNLVELWVVATRPAERNGLGMSPAAVAAELARIKSMFELLPDTPAIYPVWESLVPGLREARARCPAGRRRLAARSAELRSFDVQPLHRPFCGDPLDTGKTGMITSG